MEFSLDQTDKRIIEVLEENGKLAIKEIAAKVGLSATPVFERIKKMEASGVISGYHARINRKALDRNLMAVCSVSLNEHKIEFLREFEREIVKFDEVEECLHVAGQFDYLLRVTTPDMEAYRNFVTVKLASLKNISHVQSSFVMTEVKSL